MGGRNDEAARPWTASRRPTSAFSKKTSVLPRSRSAATSSTLRQRQPSRKAKGRTTNPRTFPKRRPSFSSLTGPSRSLLARALALPPARGSRPSNTARGSRAADPRSPSLDPATWRYSRGSEARARRPNPDDDTRHDPARPASLSPPAPLEPVGRPHRRLAGTGWWTATEPLDDLTSAFADRAEGLGEGRTQRADIHKKGAPLPRARRPLSSFVLGRPLPQAARQGKNGISRKTGSGASREAPAPFSWQARSQREGARNARRVHPRTAQDWPTSIWSQPPVIAAVSNPYFRTRDSIGSPSLRTRTVRVPSIRRWTCVVLKRQERLNTQTKSKSKIDAVWGKGQGWVIDFSPKSKPFGGVVLSQ